MNRAVLTATRRAVRRCLAVTAALVFPVLAPLAAQAQTLIAEYRMDEAAWTGAPGEVADSSGNAHHGTAINSAGTANGRLCRAGWFRGEGYNAPPNNTWYTAQYYVAVPDRDALSPLLANNNAALTLSAWIRPDSLDGTVLHKGEGGNTQEYRLHLQGGKLQFTVWNRYGSPSSLTLNHTLVSGQWYFFAATAKRRGASDHITLEIKLYGAAGDSPLATASSPNLSIDLTNKDTSGRLFIGATSWGATPTNYFNGLIDELRLHSHTQNQDVNAVALKNASRLCATPQPDCGSGQVIHGMPRMEVAAFTVVDTYTRPISTTVNFTQDFTVPPLVFTLPTIDGNNTAAHRIRNITRSGFEIMTVEPEGEDGPHVAMGLNFLAIEPGIYVLPDGHKLEACSFETTRAQMSRSAKEWESVSFRSGFSAAPAVLGQVQTMHNEVGNVPSKPSVPWLTTAISGVSASAAKMALERSETQSGNIVQPERIAYLAAEPTNGRKSFQVGTTTIQYEILRSAPVVKGWNSCTAINYSSPWTNSAGARIRPIPLASMNTRGGDAEAGEDDGGWLRRCKESLTNESTRIQLVVDEIRLGAYNWDNNRTHNTGERAGIFVFSDNFVTNPVNLHHFEFEHPANGLTCTSSDIVLKACANPDCSERYTGNVTVALSPNDSNSYWSGPNLVANIVEFSGGSVNLQLRHVEPGQITLGASGTPVPSSNLVCRSGGSETLCKMVFDSAGLVFDIPTQIANKLSDSITISAVKASEDDPQRCAPALTGTRRVKFWSEYVDPNTGSRAVSVKGTAVAGAAPGTELTLNFNADAQATITVHYNDAGKMRLNAHYQGTAANGDEGLTLSGEDEFVVKPVGLCVKSASGQCEAGDHTCNKFKAAGEPFHLTVRAVAWESDSDEDLCTGNQTTPNYRQAGVELDSELVAPNDGHSGSVGVNSIDFEAADAGQKTVAQSISEVGVFRFTATPPAGAYFGETVAGGVSAPIGRFTPSRLAVSENTPLFEHACAAGGFSYLGQPFGFLTDPQIIVTGRNAANGVTQNYGGRFWRLASSLAGRSYQNAAPGTNANLSVDQAGTAGPWIGKEDYDGKATVTVSGVKLRYEKPANPEAPFDARVHLDLTAADLTDEDGICHDPDGDGDCDGFRLANIGGTQLRWGRLEVERRHQHLETEPVTLPLRAKYFAGSRFVLNADDNCSALTDNGKLHLDNGSEPTQTDGNIIVGGGITTLSGLGSFAGGELALQFSAPGLGNAGFVDVTPQLEAAGLSWLRYDWDGDGAHDDNPRGRASWGLYRGNPKVIRIRDVWR
ncbi:hypothetical protein C3497_10165 [Zoogloeaceae bacteirum Par-f-2]|nr:hypothetical protein C3497_10165 [Zoogloeaceae bacteirum Par-f-2]